jgi:GTP:adenosylcobinamide-phosphate guanylyltransferase
MIPYTFFGSAQVMRTVYKKPPEAVFDIYFLVLPLSNRPGSVSVIKTEIEGFIADMNFVFIYSTTPPLRMF